MRSRVGLCDAQAWRRAVSLRDPVTQLKRTHPHVNRATFKLLEIASRLLSDAPPRAAAFLAEAPGGFLFAAKSLWPTCECHAMSKVPGIPFSNPDDAAVIRDLPSGGDLLDADAESAIVDHCGAAAMDLVTADGGMDIVSLDAEEQEATPLVLAQTAVALRLLNARASFVLKVFEGCTLPTREVFECLRGLFETVMLHKPRTSKSCNSERYIVCMHLKSPAAARDVARSLRDVVGTTQKNGVFVTTLGIPVSAMTHEAFDRMAEEQAQAIDSLITSIDRVDTATPRNLAISDARYVTKLIDGKLNHGGACE